jgi:hypothetical protein
MITARILVASVLAAALARGVWALVHAVVGDALAGEVLSVGLALAAAVALYAKLTLAMQIPEARQIETLVTGRLRARRA